MTSDNFQYIISFDLEATCWRPSNYAKAEVIEIAAVLLNLKSGKIESEFHKFIRPTHHPILSDFCVNLTGITQSMIDRQETFSTVFNQFVSWLDNIRIEHGVHLTTPNQKSVKSGANATLCSWTDWDLFEFLPLDCKRNGIECPDSLKAWIDVRKKYDQFYNSLRGMPFARALDKIQY
ncbi:hypothetical protein HA402_014846 [Bradysia odoriphaga]|nr:hypothetical protein HA402_014846 [Bradysia odoriphaga]